MGIEADSGRLDKLLEELEGKDIAEVIGAGISKLASVPSGAGGGMAAAGGGGGGGGAAAGGGDAGAAKEEEAEAEKEKEEEEEDDGAPWPALGVCRSGSAAAPSLRTEDIFLQPVIQTEQFLPARGRLHSAGCLGSALRYYALVCNVEGHWLRAGVAGTQTWASRCSTRQRRAHGGTA